MSLLTFGLGFYSGAQRTSTFAENGKTESPLLGEVKKLLDQNYVSWKSTSTLPTDRELEYGMIQGYVNAYKDPYTVFFPPRDAKAFAQEAHGSFGGVGMQVGTKNGAIIVIAPLKDSPAMKAGIKAGDVVIAIDGKTTYGMSTDEAVSKIRGEIGTKVKLELAREGDKRSYTVEITRSEISVPTLETEKKDDVFIVRLYNFSELAPMKFKGAMEEFLKSGTRYLIIDLRGNPGGYLESAVDIASYFLDEGAQIVNEGGSRSEGRRYVSHGYNYFNQNLRLVVLVDKGSASASEILAGALKDYKKATIVGETTFGKGSVQRLLNLTDGSALKVTIAKWFTPGGVNISEQGIKPDVEATFDVKLYEEKKVDSQLKKAIETLKQMK